MPPVGVIVVSMPGGTLMRYVKVVAVHARLGEERRFGFCQLRAGADEHLLDCAIRAETDGGRPDFRRHMPVAEMPNQPRKLMRIVVVRLHKRLGRCAHEQPASIAEPQPVAIGHNHRMRQVEQDGLAMIRRQPDAAAVPRLEI